MAASTPLPTGTATPVGESGSSVGSVTAASGNTVLYSAPSGVPIYTGAALQQAQSFQWTYNGVSRVGIPQGDVLLQASVPSDPANPSAVAVSYQLIQMFSAPSLYLVPAMPTTPISTTPIVNVARNGSFAFYGGAVGAVPCATPAACALISATAPPFSTDNGVIWSVGPAPFASTTQVTGGNATLGTITQNGVYTAPATIPNPLPVVELNSHSVNQTKANGGNSSNFTYVNIY